jgi:hypothetical protein
MGFAFLDKNILEGFTIELRMSPVTDFVQYEVIE